MGDIIDAIWDRELVTGLAFGVGALVLSWMSGLTFRHRNGRTARVGGVLLTLAALLALPVAISVPPRLWWGLGLLVGGGLAVQTWSWLAPFGPALAMPGAWLVGAEAVLPGAWWMRWFVVVVIVAGAPLVSRFATHPLTGIWTPVMFATFSIGIFLSVPDTEEALVLLGASLPMAVLSVPGSPSRFGAGGTYATIGVAFWVIFQGGVGRPAAIIGVTACLGLLLADPMARLLSSGYGSVLDRLPVGWGGLAAASFVQLVLVVAVARTAGVAVGVAAATLSGTTFLMLEVVLLALGKPKINRFETAQSTWTPKP